MKQQSPKPTRRPAWQRSAFDQDNSDPLAGFANIMDVMLVFALGLMLVLVVRSEELRQHFNLEQKVEVTAAKELVDAPESIKEMVGGNGERMESLGQVYRDPKTGKLILVGGE